MGENTFSGDSPFAGTPWNSDQEIYDYASNLRYNMGWTWENVKNSMVSQGLNSDYAEAIVNNLIAVEPQTPPDPFDGLDVIDNRGMFRRPFSFSGRIRRTEYCLSLLLYYAAISGFGIILGMLIGLTGVDVFLFLFYILLIPAVWFLWAQGAKRCHDLGHSGWFQIIPFYIFWMMFAPGDRETTGYGTSPKAAF